MIKSMAAPYTKMKFMPTGGINAKNLTSYLDFKKIIACGGSWMVNKDMIAAKDWDGITALTKEAVSTMLGFKLLHVGVNNASEEVAAAESAKFATLLGENVKVGNSSMFVGSLIGWMVLIPVICLFGADTVMYPGTETISALYAAGGASKIWSTYVKYIGAGAIATGGIISLIKSLPLIIATFRDSMKSMKGGKNTSTERTA